MKVSPEADTGPRPRWGKHQAATPNGPVPAALPSRCSSASPPCPALGRRLLKGRRQGPCPGDSRGLSENTRRPLHSAGCLSFDNKGSYAYLRVKLLTARPQGKLTILQAGKDRSCRSSEKSLNPAFWGDVLEFTLGSGLRGSQRCVRLHPWPPKALRSIEGENK